MPTQTPHSKYTSNPFKTNGKHSQFRNDSRGLISNNALKCLTRSMQLAHLSHAAHKRDSYRLPESRQDPFKKQPVASQVPIREYPARPANDNSPPMINTNHKTSLNLFPQKHSPHPRFSTHLFPGDPLRTLETTNIKFLPKSDKPISKLNKISNRTQ